MNGTYGSIELPATRSPAVQTRFFADTLSHCPTYGVVVQGVRARPNIRKLR